jgi:hypothetical protein
MLNGAETCRRCRAELGNAQRVEREGQVLLDAAIHHLACDNSAAATRLLQRAMALHATPAIRALWRLVKAPLR